jgi:hypothetical protein
MRYLSTSFCTIQCGGWGWGEVRLMARDHRQNMRLKDTLETREKREEEREAKESRDKIQEGQKPRDQRQGNEKGE